MNLLSVTHLNLVGSLRNKNITLLSMVHVTYPLKILATTDAHRSHHIATYRRAKNITDRCGDAIMIW